jgi:RNA polymerase Rpb2, domain 6
MDKGVICQVEPTWKMPVDEEGNVADVIMDGGSTINRMNTGRLYEQYYNAASRQTHNLICRMLSIAPYTKDETALDHLNGLDHTVLESSFETLLGYYNLLYPDMVQWARQHTETLAEFMSFIVSKGIYIYLPTDNKKESVQIVKDIESSIYRPHFGKVSYVGNSGQRVVTKDNIRIASMYILLLEKTGDDWSSVSSSKLQHLGVIAPLTKQDKHAKPARLQAVKGAGEAEVRIFTSYAKGNFTVEMMDRNNSPKTHKHMVNAILGAPTPSNIDSLVDRTVIPFGGSKPLSLIRHISECAGFKFKYTPFDASKPSGMIENGDAD